MIARTAPFPRRFARAFSALAYCAFALRAFAADEVRADLTFKLPPGQVAKYRWTTFSNTESSGREKDQVFTLKKDLSLEMDLVLKGLARKTPGLPLSVKAEKYGYSEKTSIGSDVGEIVAMKGKFKVTHSGKVIVDSDNDVGLEEIKNLQQGLKQIEAGEMVVTLDPAGKEIGEAEGDETAIDVIKGSGAEGLFRLLAGRELKPGDSWEDSQTLPNMATFKLAKPAVIRSKSTFVGWETKDGKRLARIDVASTWDTSDLKGENGEGLLVEITRVEGKGAGRCYFDPALSRVVDGELSVNSKYRIDGKKDGQSTGLDVVGKTVFSFKEIP
ncbi:MAG TPA: hypothetical protein VKX17_02035 [Planctomycetota bacterium]|nr:hypothetical protein [Planctomycetota bacterium]